MKGDCQEGSSYHAKQRHLLNIVSLHVFISPVSEKYLLLDIRKINLFSWHKLFTEGNRAYVISAVIVALRPMQHKRSCPCVASLGTLVLKSPMPVIGSPYPKIKRLW